MRATDGEEFLLHIEIANNNVSNMPLRMLRYYTDIRLAGHQGPVRQFLIYIGTDRLTMRRASTSRGCSTTVDMHQIDCTGLLA